MTRLIGRRMTKEVNLLGALYPAARAVELGLWNRVVDTERLGAEVDALIQVLLSKNQQAVRQLKLIIDKGAEADLHTRAGLRDTLGRPDRGRRWRVGRARRRPAQRHRELRHRW